MIASSSNATPLTLTFVEGCFTAIAFAASFAWPRMGSSWFSKIERAFGRLARRQGLSVAVVGFSTLLLRLAILPVFPIPLPFVPDDFSFLLAADTFLHGRLANPTPVMWTHFETIHVTMLPTYTSMYFPAQGLVMAAGKLLFGHPWFGILVTSALMCAAICWMLQAWLPPTWAFLGGMIAVLRIGLFSYWINTYTGGGLITALGGALVLGSLPRLMKTASFRYGLLMGIGIILLACTRPYESLLLCLPVAFVLGRWAFRGKNRPPAAVLLRRAAFPLVLIVAAGAWMGYYNYRAFGSPTTLPYTVDRATYAVAPYYIWQSQRPDPVYRQIALREFYHGPELEIYSKARSVTGFIKTSGVKIITILQFFTGFILLPPLIMARRVFLDRRIRFLVLGLLVLAAGMSIEIYLIPHYVAPFTAAIYAIGLQLMRHLRLWKPEGKPVGVTLVRLIVVLCFALGGLRLFAGPLNMRIPEWPASNWSCGWCGPDQYGAERAQIETQLESLPGKQLALVRYSHDRDSLDQWVYNGADIDGSKVIWAWDMGSGNNTELASYYKGRQVWLIDMNSQPAKISPYLLPAQSASVAH